MIIFEGRVFNLEGKWVKVGEDQRFVLNFTVSKYLGKDKKEKPIYRSYSVSVWDKRGEGLNNILKEKSLVSIKSEHYKAEGYEGTNGIAAKIKVDIGAGDRLDILALPGGDNTNTIADSDFADQDSGEKNPDDVPF